MDGGYAEGQSSGEGGGGRSTMDSHFDPGPGRRTVSTGGGEWDVDEDG